MAPKPSIRRLLLRTERRLWFGSLGLLTIIVGGFTVAGLSRAEGFGRERSVVAAPGGESDKAPTKPPDDQDGAVFDYNVPRSALESDLITPVEAKLAQTIVLSHQTVIELLSGDDFAVVDVELDESGLYTKEGGNCDGPRSCAVVTIVDYSAATTMTVDVDLMRGTITSLGASPGTLTVVSANEDEAAYQIAVSDRTITAALAKRQFSEWAEPTPVTTSSGRCSSDTHRCIMVRVEVDPDLLYVIVDLTDRRVDSDWWDLGRLAEAQ